MLNVKATTVSCKKLLLWLFLISIPMFAGWRACACDKEGFVFEEFGLRCQRISEYIKDLQIAQKMSLPSVNERRSKLLNEWVSFFLDHGQAPPASFTLIPNERWHQSLVKAGETIGELAYQRIPPEKADSACIPFDLLSQPVKHEAVMALLASWSEAIREPAGETIPQTSEWLGKNLGFFVQINRTLGTDYPDELQHSKELVKYFNQQWKFVMEAPTNAATTVYKFTRDELANRLKEELARWSLLAFR